MGDATIAQLLRSGTTNLQWINANIDYIRSKYNNQFVAVYDEHVVESDKNIQKLMRKLDNKGLDASQVVVKFISKVKAIL